MYANTRNAAFSIHIAVPMWTTGIYPHLGTSELRVIVLSFLIPEIWRLSQRHVAAPLLSSSHLSLPNYKISAPNNDTSCAAVHILLV
jgi:hypothetical protein